MNEKITKIVCKKTLREGGEYIYGEYIKGVQYDKFILETEELSRSNPIPYTYKYIYIYNKNGIGGFRFHLDKNTRENPNFLCFYDYFYDNKELRKLKIKQLNLIQK